MENKIYSFSASELEKERTNKLVPGMLYWVSKVWTENVVMSPTGGTDPCTFARLVPLDDHGQPLPNLIPLDDHGQPLPSVDIVVTIDWWATDLRLSKYKPVGEMQKQTIFLPELLG